MHSSVAHFFGTRPQPGGLLRRRDFLKRISLSAAVLAAPAALRAGPWLDNLSSSRPHGLIGYTEFRTNLPGGRHANSSTGRACIVNADGTGRRRLAEELTRKPDYSSQFAGWSPDGRQAILGIGWESPENAAWEEAHKVFRYNSKGWLFDNYLLDLQTGSLTNVTTVERLSYFNSGLFFWPGNPKKLGFVALIGQDSHPFSMDLDGRNKKDLTENSREFAYGFDASPDGKRIAYHKSYQIYIAETDGSNANKVKTGKPFNFGPQWSPDGSWILFLAGERENCDPYVVRRDGSELRKLASRQGYKGSVMVFDVPDFHQGSSDVPIWSPDGQWVYYTAQVGRNVEIMRVSLAGKVEEMTHSRSGSLNYLPKPSPDGKWVIFGSNRSGTRQLYVSRTNGRDQYAITHVKAGWGAMWPHWQPIDNPR